MPRSQLMSPLLWQTVPFADRDAWLDFLGVHQQWHIALAVNTNTRLVAIDDLRAGQLVRHAQMHADVAKALAIAAAYDLVSYDLRDRESFSAFMQTHALDHVRLRTSAGI